MSVQTPKLLVPPPTVPIQAGRGFYQLEEDSLYVQIGAFMGNRHFFSYLESDSLRMEFDRDGHLLFIEYSKPRRQWRIQDNLIIPTITHAGDIRWLDFRQQIAEPLVFANRKKTELCWQFSPEPVQEYLSLASSLIAGITTHRTLATLWLSDIEDDIAGQEIAAFRKALREPQDAMRLTAVHA